MAQLARPVLVVAPVGTPADVERLRAYGLSVATELGAPATYATHNEHRVTDFDAVYCMTPSTSLRDRVGLLLVAEALLAGIPVYEPQAAEDVDTCDCGQVQSVRTVRGDDGAVWCAECREESACAWCFEWNDMEDLDVVEHGTTWVPLHPGCRAGLEHATAPTHRVPLAA
ncbi:hypothetical protein [Streptomyces sp. SGAir0957]